MGGFKLAAFCKPKIRELLLQGQAWRQCRRKWPFQALVRMDDWGLNWWFEATGRLLHPQNWMCELPDPFFWGGVLFHG